MDASGKGKLLEPEGQEYLYKDQFLFPSKTWHTLKQQGPTDESD